MCFYVSKSDLQQLLDTGAIQASYFTQVVEEVTELVGSLVSVRAEWDEDGEYCSLQVSSVSSDTDTSKLYWSYVDANDWLASRE